MKTIVLQEADYFADMREIVEPCLAARGRELWLEREPGRKLYCMFYRADQPVGTVVICHGFTETEEKYRENIYYFLKKQYNVYMMEHCGHGRSYRLSEDLSLVHVDSYMRYVNDALAVAHLAKEEQKDLPLYLYGHSMGGGISAAVLAAEPGLFQKAVLSSPMIRPLTGGVPWPLAKAIVNVMRLLGKGGAYVPGQHAFDRALETFEGSASTCRERFAFYQEKRSAEPLYQMSGASCGWLCEAARLNKFLCTQGYKRIATPLLIFQASDDTFVSNREQNRFAEKIRRAGKAAVKLVHVPDSRHEIFNSSTEVVQKYWNMIFHFLK